MALLDKITEKILQIDGSEFSRKKGAQPAPQRVLPLCHGDSEHIKIKRRKISLESCYIDGNTEGSRCTFGGGRCLWHEG